MSLRQREEIQAVLSCYSATRVDHSRGCSAGSDQELVHPLARASLFRRFSCSVNYQPLDPTPGAIVDQRVSLLASYLGRRCCLRSSRVDSRISSEVDFRISQIAEEMRGVGAHQCPSC